MAIVRVVALVYKDGHKDTMIDRPIIQWAGRLLEAAADDTLDTLVLGQVDDTTNPAKVVWERQYGRMTVLPSDFGRRRPVEVEEVGK